MDEFSSVFDLAAVEKEYIRGEAEKILKGVNLTWHDLQGKTVLDLGSGPYMLERAANEFHTDVDVVSLNFFRFTEDGKTPTKAIRAVRADALKPPFAENSFDFVICSGTFGFREDWSHVLNVLPTLKKEGEMRFYPFMTVFDIWALEEGRDDDWKLKQRFEVIAQGRDGDIPRFTTDEWNKIIRQKGEELHDMLGEDYIVETRGIEDVEHWELGNRLTIKKNT